jgi:hypothetical protein
MQPAQQVELAVEPAEIVEWEAEDALASVLGDEERLADPDEVHEMLGAVRFTLPSALTTQELVRYATERKTPLEEEVRPDLDHFDYHLVEMPLNVLVPPQQRLVRLRLTLDMKSNGPEPVVAYDIFPPDRWSVTEHDLGEVSVDVSKALQFVSPIPIGDVLGFKLKVPLHWKTRAVQIATSDRNSNPAEWYVTDEEIANAFVAYMIVRASPRGAAVTIRAKLAGELRRSGPLGVLKGRFRSTPDDERIFSL